MPLPVPRRFSKLEVPIHFVWAVFKRRPLLTPEVEQYVHRIIQHETQKLGRTVLALNGMPDHVHLAVLFTPTVSIMYFVQQVKLAVRRALRDRYGTEHFFRWEQGYSAFAFPYGQRSRVIEYIQNQKSHHENGKLYAYWEEIGEWRDDFGVRETVGELCSSGGSEALGYPAD